MLKTPPGISKRKVHSVPLEEAGVQFENLYKKHLSLDPDSLQKQAENYLLKSFYQKSSSNNNSVYGTSDFSELRKANTSQSANLECVANSRDNYNKKTSLDLNNDSKTNELNKKETNLLPHQLAEVKEDKGESLDYNYYKTSSNQSLNKKNSYNLYNSDLEKVNSSNDLGENIKVEENLFPLNRQKEKRKKGTKLVKKKKKLEKELKREDSLIYVEESSDFSEESVENKKPEKNFLVVEERFNSDLDQVDEFLSVSKSSNKKRDSRRSLLNQTKELLFLSTVCILFETLYTLVLFGLFFLCISFNYHEKIGFINHILPFLIHFGVIYIIFNSTDKALKSKFLVYSNDITIELLTQRLNKELVFRKLSILSSWSERTLVVVGLLISCFPVNFTADFTSFATPEYLYLGLLVIYFSLHVLFTFYYFAYKFKKSLVTLMEKKMLTKISEIGSKLRIFGNTFNPCNKLINGKIGCNSGPIQGQIIGDPLSENNVLVEFKKRLYKSYKSRKLSLPSTKTRRRHAQLNR